MVLTFPKIEDTTICYACFCDYCGVTMESPIGCSENIKILCFMYKCFYFFPISCRYEGACFEMWNNTPLELCEFTFRRHFLICVQGCSLPVDAEGQIPCALAGCMGILPGLMLWSSKKGVVIGCCKKGSEIGAGSAGKTGAVAAAPATTTIIIQQGAPGIEEMV
jgi:hypothetical protein